MLRHLYSVLFTLLLPLVLLRLWLRGRTLPGYRQRWGERFAHFNAPKLGEQKRIWLHTVSVGEFIAARPLINKLLENNYTLIITTMTPTGSERVQAAYGDRVFHVYAPYDIPFLVNRFLTKTKPHLAIFLETELWPNILHCCKRKSVATLLANARLSEKSARGYRKVSWLAKPMLDNLSCAAIQNQQDAERFYALGFSKTKAKVTGSIKFDIVIPAYLRDEAQSLQLAISDNNTRKIWIAASTHKGEDEIILDAHAQVLQKAPDTRLILVPRHPDRFDKVYQLCIDSGYKTLRRSEIGNKVANKEYSVLLGDTMGELMLLFGSAHVAFVGGSFVDNGGHNYIEPSVWAVPVLSGPSQFNFSEISRLLMEAGGMITVQNAEQLAEQVLSLFSGEALSRGKAAKQVAEQNQGALARLLSITEELLHS
ncbi:3-deoxy-D-manno-octulosonic-acid transferase [Alteromonadaceae bacterium Bs31]|nr:3-deoxy-D-manno-octulosonic-acid transferase [Alteromonadaceae bacterium Bs31]